MDFLSCIICLLSCIICLCLICFIFIKTFHIFPTSKANRKRLPPAPKPFPVIGNLLELGDKPHKSLTKLAKTHGVIMSLKLGEVTTIVISSADIAKEILRKICSGELFANRILKSNGDIPHKKVQELLAETRLCSLTGEAVDNGIATFKTTLNLLSNTIFSVDLAGRDSHKAGALKELIWNIMKEAGNPNLADFLPVLKRIDPQGIRRRMEGHMRKIMALLGHLISQRLQSRKESGCITDGDFLDILLRIGEEKSEEMDKITILHLLRDSISRGPMERCTCELRRHLQRHIPACNHDHRLGMVPRMESITGQLGILRGRHGRIMAVAGLSSLQVRLDVRCCT